jgi:hypothetical protein
VIGRGNRAFAAFIGVCAVALLLIGMGACVLLAIVGYRVQQDGFAALTAGGNDVRPALVFLVIVAAGAVAGLCSLWRQWQATGLLQSRIEELQLPVPSRLAEIADSARVAGRVDLVDAAEPFSFTHGLGAARIVVSRGLAESLTDAELAAVIEHERYHVRHLDPLKVFVTRLLAPTLFFLPALRDLRGRYVADRELAADRRALRRHGTRPLAGALLKVVGSPVWAELTPAAAIGGDDALDARVSQLESGEPPPAPRWSRWSLATSAAGATVLLGVLATSVFAFGGPSALSRLCSG